MQHRGNICSAGTEMGLVILPVDTQTLGEFGYISSRYTYDTVVDSLVQKLREVWLYFQLIHITNRGSMCIAGTERGLVKLPVDTHSTVVVCVAREPNKVWL